MRQVFISYSSKDYAQALAVRNVLEQNGITCWMAPESIPGGSNYTKEIPIAIRGCQAFVLMLSNNAQNSHWVLKELDSAVNAGKIILPFQLEDVPLSDEFNFLLTGAQRYDAYQRKAEAMSLLVSRIKAIIQAGGVAPESEDAPGEEPAQPKPHNPEPVNLGEQFGDIFGGAAKKAPAQNQAHPEKHKNFAIQGGHTCPACGSANVVEFPNQVKPRDVAEHLINIVCGAAMSLLGFGLGGVVMILLTDFMYFDLDLDGDLLDFFYGLIPLVMIAGAVGGLILSGHLVKTWLRRQRIRKHVKVAECRCNTCQKKFQAVDNQ